VSSLFELNFITKVLLLLVARYRRRSIALRAFVVAMRT